MVKCIYVDHRIAYPVDLAQHKRDHAADGAGIEVRRLCAELILRNERRVLNLYDQLGFPVRRPRAAVFPAKGTATLPDVNLPCR